VWAYFLLLIFEGALRKWVAPGLSSPLLLVRDPVALWLVVEAWRRGLLPTSIYLTGTATIGVIGLITATLLGHGNLLVALYGARILLLHFPLIFVIGRVFNREDVVEMGKATLMIAIPMVVLVTLQFYSPQSAWVNRGIGGNLEGAGFSGSMGFFRPPGTFSFTNGNTTFFSFVAPFAFYFWLNRRSINSLLLIGATLALFFAVPLSISRGLLFQVAISLLFLLIASARKPENLGRLLIATLAGMLVLSLLSQSDLFATASEAFTSRFETANEAEGGLEGVILDRFLGGLIDSLTNPSSWGLPFFGYGIGMGTNVGSQLLVGKLTFLISEGEWGRIIGEMGLLVGLGLIILRLGLTYKLAWASYQKLAEGDVLPWMLGSVGFLYTAQGAWAQPTSLGFCIMIGGLMIASFRLPIRERGKVIAQ
jgi:hypothetical protein